MLFLLLSILLERWLQLVLAPCETCEPAKLDFLPTLRVAVTDSVDSGLGASLNTLLFRLVESDRVSSCVSSLSMTLGDKFDRRPSSSFRYGVRKANSWENLGGFIFDAAWPLLVLRKFKAFLWLSLILVQRSLHAVPVTIFFFCFSFLATGNLFRSLSFSFRIGERTVRRIMYSTCEAIFEVLQPIVMPKPTEDAWVKSEKVFL